MIRRFCFIHYVPTRLIAYKFHFQKKTSRIRSGFLIIDEQQERNPHKHKKQLYRTYQIIFYHESITLLILFI